MDKLAQRGIMNVAVKTENGFTITREHGFTIVEENGKVLGFDLVDHPDLGVSLLFGDQVFVLRFWKDEDLDKGLAMLTTAVEKEKNRRKDLRKDS